MQCRWPQRHLLLRLLQPPPRQLQLLLPLQAKRLRLPPIRHVQRLRAVGLRVAKVPLAALRQSQHQRQRPRSCSVPMASRWPIGKLSSFVRASAPKRRPPAPRLLLARPMVTLMPTAKKEPKAQKATGSAPIAAVAAVATRIAAKAPRGPRVIGPMAHVQRALVPMAHVLMAHEMWAHVTRDSATTDSAMPDSARIAMTAMTAMTATSATIGMTAATARAAAKPPRVQHRSSQCRFRAISICATRAMASCA